MKKNLPSVSNGKTPAKRGSATNRPAARDITPTATRSASVSSVNSKSNSGKKSTGKKNGKKSNKVVPIVASVAGVILVCGVAAGCLYKKGFFEEKYPMTMADGTVVEMTADEISNAIVRDTFCNGVFIDGVAAGTTGESATMSHEEHRRVVEILIDEVDGRVQTIAGSGSNSTNEAIQLTTFAEFWNYSHIYNLGHKKWKSCDYNRKEQRAEF